MAPVIEKFVEQSIVDILIPQASDLDIEEALAAAYNEKDLDAPVLSSIPQRDVLFFGKIPRGSAHGTVSYSFVGVT